MSESKHEPKKRFPLTLDALTGDSGRKRASMSSRSNSPQTASQNAARYAPPERSATASRPPSGAPLLIERAANSSMVSEAVRKAMVARIAQQGVKDPQVLAAMEAVPRHFFLEPGLASQAYIDASLPIGYHQTISQPYIVARMIEVLKAGARQPMKRVLEIGTGCGYQAAVLAQVATEVYSIERIKPLHELARANLRALRIPNLRLHYGDGMLGFPQLAPFDGIILAAAGLQVPPGLLDQLSVGGRLIAPVGSRDQVLQLICRIGENEWTTETLEHCHFVPLRPGTHG